MEDKLHFLQSAANKTIRDNYFTQIAWIYLISSERVIRQNLGRKGSVQLTAQYMSSCHEGQKLNLIFPWYIAYVWVFIISFVCVCVCVMYVLLNVGKICATLQIHTIKHSHAHWTELHWIERQRWFEQQNISNQKHFVIGRDTNFKLFT